MSTDSTRRLARQGFPRSSAGFLLFASVILSLVQSASCQAAATPDQVVVSSLPGDDSMEGLAFQGRVFRLGSIGLTSALPSGQSSTDLLRLDDYHILANGTVIATNARGMWEHKATWEKLVSPFTSGDDRSVRVTSTGASLVLVKDAVAMIKDFSPSTPWRSLPTATCKAIVGIAVESKVIDIVCDDGLTKDSFTTLSTFRSVDAGHTWASTGDIHSRSWEDLPLDDDFSSTPVTLINTSAMVIAYTPSELYVRSTNETVWHDVAPPLFAGKVVALDHLLLATNRSVWLSSVNHGLTWKNTTTNSRALFVPHQDELILVHREEDEDDEDQTFSRVERLSLDGKSRPLTAPPLTTIQSAKSSGSQLILLGVDRMAQLDLQANGNWRVITGLLPKDVSVLAYVGRGLSLVGKSVYTLNTSSHAWTPSQIPTGRSKYQVVKARPGTATTYLQGTSTFKTDDGIAWKKIQPPSGYHIKRIARVPDHTYILADADKTPEEILPNKPRDQTKTITLDDDEVSDSSGPGGRVFESTDDLTWRAVAEFPYSLAGIRDLAVDSQGALYILTRADLVGKSPGGPWRNLRTGMLVGRRLKSIHVTAGDAIFLQTEQGVYWSADQGTQWNTDARLRLLTAEFGIKDQSDSFVAFNEARYLRVESHITTGQLLSLSIDISYPAGFEPSIVTVDNKEVFDLRAERAADGSVLLRGPKAALEKYSNGLHEVGVKVRRGAQQLSFQAYFYKEMVKARAFRPYAKSYAVVVGASGAWATGEFANLTEAVAQAKRVANVLRGQGFIVLEMYEADASSLKVAAVMNDLAQKVTSEDRVLFYFSGHGVTHVNAGTGGEEGYLLTYGASNATITSQGLPMYTLLGDYGRRIEAKHMLFVLDACFSGLAIEKAALPASKEFYKYEELASYTSSYTRMVFAAGKKNEPALDKSGGLFTKAFLDAISGRADLRQNGVITMNEVQAYVAHQVGETAAFLQARQTPQLGRQGEGEFVFITGPKAIP